MKEDYSHWDVNNELRPTKMGILEEGMLCNQKCTICYHRYTTFDAPEGKRQTWMKSFEEMKKELDNMKSRGCNRFDTSGGEPLLNKDMVKTIEYAKKIGLEPRIITNGNHEKEKFDEIIKAGCKDFLFSFHCLDENHDKMTQIKGSFKKMIDNLTYTTSKGCIYATNTVIFNDNYKSLPSIIKTIISQNRLPYIINLININPQYEPNDSDAHRDIAAEVSKSKEYIQEAIDIAQEYNVWVNLRYYPMCVLDESYRKHIVQYPQVMFDWRNEWDYGVNPKCVSTYLKHSYSAFIRPSSHNEGKCKICGIKGVCGGINAKYVDTFGENELIPQKIKSNNPNYYRSEQDMTTIIIPSYNPGANLTRLLTEIQHKTHPPYNVVIVRGERSAARNRNEGLDAVSKNSKFIIQIDDDICELPYMWNRRMTDKLLYDPELMMASARLMTTDGRPALNSADNFNIDSEFEYVNLVPTACLAFRSEDVLKTNTWFEELMVASGWEDSLFVEQMKHRLERLGLGTKIIIDNNCKVVHLNNATGQNQWNDYNRQIFNQRLHEEKLKDKES